MSHNLSIGILDTEKVSTVEPSFLRRRLSRARYATLALPIFIVALVFGAGLRTGVQLKQHQDVSVALSPISPVTHHLAARDTTVQEAPLDTFVLNGLSGQAPQTRNYDFTVSQLDGSPDGVSKPMLVVNGQFPGPTIEANQGDRLVIKVTNQLTTRTTIHWHGLYQNGTNFYDGTAAVTECGIPPGESLTYDFSVADFSGTTWWHAHFDTQYTDGIFGALIVHPSAAPPSGFPTWDEDLIVDLVDVYHTLSSTLAAEYLAGTAPGGGLALETPDSGAINGLGQYNGGGSYFNFSLEANKTYRLRLIHSGSSAQIRFSVDYHPLTVIEADSTLVEPYTVAGVTLAVAQRYSVLLTTNQTAGNGTYWMRAELSSALTVAGTNTDVRGIIRYGAADNTTLPSATTDPGAGSGLGDMDVSQLVPAVVNTPPASTKSYNVNFAIGVNSAGGAVATINGTSWSPLSSSSTLLNIVDAAKNGSTYAAEGSSVEDGNQFIITEDDIQVVDLLLQNTGAGAHPFHLHGHTPWVMGFGDGTYSGQALNTVNPLTRDTYLVPSSGWMIVRFITDNPGAWTIHCHIAWHMAAGLLMQVNSLPSKSAQFDIPADIISQCSA